jgi:hypothetical protein
MISFLINLIIALIIFGLLYWAVSAVLSVLPVPPIVHRLVMVLFILILVLYIIAVLTGNGPHWRLGGDLTLLLPVPLQAILV